MEANQEKYGVFSEAAKVSQGIKYAMRTNENFEELSLAKQEALDEIANRISRVVNGNPTENKPWVEIRNYVNLVIGN